MSAADIVRAIKEDPEAVRALAEAVAPDVVAVISTRPELRAALLEGLLREAATKADVKGLRGAIEELRNEVMTLKDTVSRMYGELKGETAGLRGEVMALKDAVGRMYSEMAALKGEVADLRSKLSDVEARMVTRDEFEALRRELAEARGEMRVIRALLVGLVIAISAQVVALLLTWLLPRLLGG